MTTPNPTFLDYITDESFRRSLVADHGEMTAALGNKCWKAVQVLAGSIIEAILLDYLLGIKTDDSKIPAILKLDLDKAVEQCKSGGILNTETASLCVVVKNYRNLIHPGRAKRLDEEVTEEKAIIASTLVRMVAADIARKRKETYGYTGEQILDKITKDPDAFIEMWASLQSKVNKHESDRLLLKLLPEMNFNLRNTWYTVETEYQHNLKQKLRCIHHCYRTLTEIAEYATQQSVLKQYLSILHEGTEAARTFYEEGLLPDCLFKIAIGNERDTIKRYMLERLKRGVSGDLLAHTREFGGWLMDEDFHDLLSIAIATHAAHEGDMQIWLDVWVERCGTDSRNRFVEYLNEVKGRYGVSLSLSDKIQKVCNMIYIPF